MSDPEQPNEQQPPQPPGRERPVRFEIDADFDFSLPEPPRESLSTRGFTLRVDGPEPERPKRRRQPAGGQSGRRRPAPTAGRQPRQSNPKRGGSDMTARILYAIPAVAILIAAIVAGGPVFAAAAGLLACITIWEFCRAADAARPFPIAAMLVAIGLVAAAYQWGFTEMMLVLVAAIPVVFVAMLTRANTDGALASASVTVLAAIWIGLPLAHAVLLREFPEHGAALIVNVLVATFVCDTAAYLGGRSFGRRPLAASISPNKTVEGLLCGIVGGALGFWFVGLYQDWLPGVDALIMGLVIAVIAPLGDLFESALKRDLGVKDMGGIMGPHGGMLDRVDALLFTLPAGYYLTLVFVA